MGHPPGARALPGEPPDHPLAAAVAAAPAVAEPAWRAELASLLRGGPGRPGQLCATAWVLDGAAERILLVAHQQLGWACPGGHVEGGETPAAAARRELWEETGLHARPGTDRLVTLSCAAMAAGAGGPAHLHWSVGYRLAVDEATAPADGARWWPLDELPAWRPADLSPTLAALGWRGRPQR